MAPCREVRRSQSMSVSGQGCMASGICSSLRQQRSWWQRQQGQAASQQSVCCMQQPIWAFASFSMRL